VGVVLPHPPSTTAQTSTHARRSSIRCGHSTGLRRDGRGQARRIGAIVDVAACGVRCMGTLPIPGQPSWACATLGLRDARPQGTFYLPRCYSGFVAIRGAPRTRWNASPAPPGSTQLPPVDTKGRSWGFPRSPDGFDPGAPRSWRGGSGWFEPPGLRKMGILSAVRVHGWQFGQTRREASQARREAGPGAPRAGDRPLGPSDGDRCTVAHRRRRSTVTA
jgi:hypothetical protein